MTVPPWLFLDLVSSHFARVLGPCLAFGGFISTVGHMLVADCMLQAGVSNHVVGILDGRASDALPGPCF